MAFLTPFLVAITEKTEHAFSWQQFDSPESTRLRAGALVLNSACFHLLSERLGDSPKAHPCDNGTITLI
jgi:hypothetical protein